MKTIDLARAILGGVGAFYLVTGTLLLFAPGWFFANVAPFASSTSIFSATPARSRCR